MHWRGPVRTEPHNLTVFPSGADFQVRKSVSLSENPVFADKRHTQGISPFYIYNGGCGGKNTGSITGITFCINQSVGAVSAGGPHLHDLLEGLHDGDVLPGQIRAADDGSSVSRDPSAYSNSGSDDLLPVHKLDHAHAALDDLNAESLNLLGFLVGGDALEVYGLGKQVAQGNGGIAASDVDAQDILCIRDNFKTCWTSSVGAFHLACFRNKALTDQIVHDFSRGDLVQIKDPCDFSLGEILMCSEATENPCRVDGSCGFGLGKLHLVHTWPDTILVYFSNSASSQRTKCPGQTSRKVGVLLR